MALKSCFSVFQNSFFHQTSGLFIHASRKTFISTVFVKPNSSLSAQTCDCNPGSSYEEPFLTKRRLNLTVVAMLVCGILPDMYNQVLAEEIELERYTDSKEGFTLLKPSSFIKVFYLFCSLLNWPSVPCTLLIWLILSYTLYSLRKSWNQILKG